MVLSLALILGLISAGIGLLVGNVIFGEVSESVICPSGGGGSGQPIGSESTNQGTLGTSANGKYYENDVLTTFQSVTGAINEGVYQEGTATIESQGEIRFGTPSQWGFLHRGNTGSNITSINFWLKGDVDGAPEYPILQNIEEPSDQTNAIYLYTQGTALRIVIDEDTNTIVSTSLGSGSRPPDDASWHMVTLIMNKGNDTGVDSFATVWLDGVRKTTAGSATTNIPFTGTGADSDQGLIWGSEKGKSAVTENGFALDDITVWNGYQLTQSNINSLYNGGAGSSAGSTGSNISPSFQKLHVTFDTGTFSSPVQSTSGTQECQNAKDTAWLVIGILPVALFFIVFAIFSTFNKF